MSQVLFTMPGKLGDNIFRLPVAYQYAKQNNTKVDICLDHGSRVLGPLIMTQPWVENVFSADGIVEYGWGGQPWNFGDSKHDEFRRMYPNVYHLGYKRGIPLGNLTMGAMQQSECIIDVSTLLTEPCLRFSKKPINNLCVHIEASEPWRAHESRATLLPCFEQLVKMFDTVKFIGLCRDKTFYNEFMISDKVSFFDDGGDLNRIVELYETSMLCGTNSSMWALANCVKIPQAVIVPRIPYNTTKKSYEKEIYVDPGNSDGLLTAISELRERYV